MTYQQKERAAPKSGPLDRVFLAGNTAIDTANHRPEQPPRSPSAGPLVIATLPKNCRERVRVALDEYQGHRLIDVRITAQLSESSGAWFPTKKGVSLAVAYLPALVRALADAEVKARELGLIGGVA